MYKFDNVHISRNMLSDVRYYLNESMQSLKDSYGMFDEYPKDKILLKHEFDEMISLYEKLKKHEEKYHDILCNQIKET